jgi:hypothetical protein
MNPDPIFALEGKKVKAVIDGQTIRGRLLSIRDGFLTIEQSGGARIALNKFEISSIAEESRPISRTPRLTRTFWR